MAAKARSKVKEPGKVITVNRRAYHDYDIMETVEAGLVLTGTEIKSVRAGQVNIRHAFARSEGGEVWLYGAHIAHYAQGNIYNHDPTRVRKLLLHKNQIGELAGTASQKGLTIIPLRIYVKNHVAKVQLGLAKGRKLYDKRRAIIDRDREREAGQAMRQISRG
jgi:SsrA-binding protein